MGQQVSRTDYEWVYTEEPHKTRRKQILGECAQEFQPVCFLTTRHGLHAYVHLLIEIQVDIENHSKTVLILVCQHYILLLDIKLIGKLYSRAQLGCQVA